MIQQTLTAAEQLATEGAECEVIDVATLKPLDSRTILESVQRTGRLVIIHEAARTAGFGAEIAACVAEDGLFDLKAPIFRVTGYDTVMPLPRLEQYYRPDTQRIVNSIKQSLHHK